MRKMNGAKRGKKRGKKCPRAMGSKVDSVLRTGEALTRWRGAGLSATRRRSNTFSIVKVAQALAASL